ncbi:MAG: hypothetical protein U9N48_09845 [Euryarchaeota archaeon]|nr:hypothetical protein [Euryarchaeota archaeon]
MSSPSSLEDAAFRVLVIAARPLDVPDLPDIADQWALQRGLAAGLDPLIQHKPRRGL